MGWRVTATVMLVTFTGTVLFVRQVTEADSDVPERTTPETTRTTGPSTPGDPGLTTPPPVAKPMPGVPAGEAALTPLSLAEVARRCQVRWDLTWGHGAPMPPIKGLLPPLGPPDPTFNAGETVIVAARPITLDNWMRVPPDEQFECSIPGDLLPGQGDLYALKENLIPTEPHALLRRCSTVLWHDISGWRIVSSSSAGRTAAALVAVSPSGKYAALCRVGGEYLLGGQTAPYLAQIVPTEPAPQYLRDKQPSVYVSFFNQVEDTCTKPHVPCIGQLYFEIHRLPRTVTKVRLESIRGGPARAVDGTVELPVAGPSTWFAVQDGWLAVAWADGSRKPCAHGRLTAYDASGHVVGYLSDPGLPPQLCKPR